MSIGSTSMIGSRFWQFADTRELMAKRVKVLNDNRDVDTTASNSGLTSFLKDGKLDRSNETVRSAINRAEIFSAAHMMTDAEQATEREKANNNATSLGIDCVKFRDEIVQLAVGRMNPAPAQEKVDRLKDSIDIALRKLLVSKEVESLVQRANRTQEGTLPTPEYLALQNAVYGLSGMLLRNEISENAVLFLDESYFYDIGNTADVLKLAATTAAKVKETFIREKELQSAITFFEGKIAEAERLGDERLVKKAKDALATLRTAVINLTNIRGQAAGGIVTEYAFSNGSGDDGKFQREQIKRIRESLRAFRYDLDRCSGKPMGKMESVRRWFDDITLNSKLRVPEKNRIDESLYRHLQNADMAYNSALAALQDCFPGGNPYERMDVQAAANEATALSHTANDAIRYYFSGAETKESKFAENVHAEFDDIVAHGGKKQVSVELGVEAMFGVGLGALVDAKAGGGGSFKVQAQLEVPPGGGAISVTYSYQGKVSGGIKGTAGADSDRVQADISAMGNISLTKSSTRVYANLDDCISEMNGKSMLMGGAFYKVVFGAAKKVAKGIASIPRIGATILGFRIHKSRMNKVAYANALRKGNVFGNLDGMLLRRKNSTAFKSRSAWKIGGGANAKASAKTSGILGADDFDETNLAFGGKVGFDISREFAVKGKAYRTFAKSIAKCSDDRVKNLFNTEVASLKQVDRNFADQIANLLVEVADDQRRNQIANGIAGLMRIYEDLEGSAAGKNENDKNFWEVFATKVRLCSIAAELLVRRGGNMDAEKKDAAFLHSLNAVKTYLSGRIENPAVRIPPAIFEKVLQKVSEVATPPVFKVQGDLEIYTTFADGLIDEDVEKSTGKPDGKGFKGVAKTFGQSLQRDTLETIRDQIGFSPRVRANFAYTRPMGKKPDVRPWVNASTFTIDVKITASMPVRLLVETIARWTAKKRAAIEDEAENERFCDEIRDDITDTILSYSLVPNAVKAAGGVLAMSVGELAAQSPSFRSFLNAAGGLPEKVNLNAANFEQEAETSKTIRFNFLNWRVSSFSVAETFEESTTLKLGFNAGLADVGLSLAYGMNTETTDYVAYTTPSVATILGAVNAQLETGNPEQLKNFLARNEKGVLRLLRAASLAQADIDAKVDGKYAADRKEMERTLNEVAEKLDKLTTLNSVLGDEAKALQQRFDAVQDMARHPAPNQTNAQRLETAREFFTVLASAYGLQARADAETKPDAA